MIHTMRQARALLGQDGLNPGPGYKCCRPGLNNFSASPRQMPILQSQSYVFDARPQYPLLVSVKRYWVQGFESTDPDALTLVLAHATSFHKELWEPVLEDLYTQAVVSPGACSPVLKIRDAWAIDCPNHGESSVLNEKTLLSSHTPICEYYYTCVYRWYFSV